MNTSTGSTKNFRTQYCVQYTWTQGYLNDFFVFFQMLMNAHKALTIVPSNALTALDLSHAPAMPDTGWPVTEGHAMVS